ncbi:hypothetical protein BJX70DRAFT_17930 [Aspergillus crustosus]
MARTLRNLFYATSLPTTEELCYSIQYVERHGRKLKDPWSLRQTGVYHMYCGRTKHSRWVLINPNDGLKTLLKNSSAIDPEVSSSGQQSIQTWTFYVQLLLTLGSDWTDYIDYLGSELQEQNNKACYSLPDDNQAKGYTLSYADLQELHMLQAKLQTAEATLNSCLSISKGSRAHLEVHFNQANLRYVFQQFDIYEAEMSRHLAQISALQIRLKRTLDLLTKPLIFRNEELLGGANQASARTLYALFDIASQGKQQQETLTRLLWHGYADSTMLKALSIVATVCMPPTLVATIFSSNLVQSADVQSADVDARGSKHHLVVSPQFWIYIAISLPLMVFVFIWIRYIGYKSRQAISAKMKEVI